MLVKLSKYSLSLNACLDIFNISFASEKSRKILEDVTKDLVYSLNIFDCISANHSRPKCHFLLVVCVMALCVTPFSNL